VTSTAYCTYLVLEPVHWRVGLRRSGRMLAAPNPGGRPKSGEMQQQNAETVRQVGLGRFEGISAAVRKLMLHGECPCVQRRQSLDWVVGMKLRCMLLVSWWWQEYGAVTSPPTALCKAYGFLDRGQVSATGSYGSTSSPTKIVLLPRDSLRQQP
jgi:hypothetical protein